MPDTFGLQTLPLPATATGDLPGDKGLGVLGAFLKASINYACDTMLGASGVRPGRHAVKQVYYHDPTSPGGFDESRLPAIYLWRGRRTRKKLADELVQKTTRIELIWIGEPASEDHFKQSNPATNAIIDAIDWALTVQRCPAWIVTGDTDLESATRGSLLNTWTGFERIQMGDESPKSLTFDRVDGDGKPLPYYGFATQLEVVEYLTRGLDGRYPNTVEGTHRTNGDATTDYTETLPIPD